MRSCDAHLVEPSLVRTDDFESFMRDRQRKLLRVIEEAMGKPAYDGEVPEEGEYVTDGGVEVRDLASNAG
jgi:hypothetical protein